MLVVSDASPLNVLVRIGLADLLPRLFDMVVIPQAVADELTHAATPQLVRQWLASRPAWLTVRTLANPIELAVLRHRGEREAIQLVQELRADLLLVDELRPRRIATSLGIAVIGTLGILERAAAEELIELNASLQKLRQTDFYVSERLLAEILKRHGERSQT